MKQLLLLSFALCIFGAANGQTYPVNGAENTWTSNLAAGEAGLWEDENTWQQPEGWAGTCGWPGCSGTIDGVAIDWETMNPTIIIKQNQTVEVMSTIRLRAFVKVEGASYDAAGNVLYGHNGGNLFFNKDNSDKGRLQFVYESFVLLEQGSDIHANSMKGSSSDFAANYIQFEGPDADDTFKLNGKKINQVQTPALLWWGMPSSCGSEGGDCNPPTPMPVDLLSYSATSEGAEVLLEWVAAKETNFSHYVVEWSTDGDAFYAAGSVTARGTEQGIQHYTFRHRPGQTGTLYYRLQGVDIDGTVENKGVEAVRIGGEVFAAYTKAGKLHINYNGPVSSQVIILDASGRLVRSAKLSAEGIETTGLTVGVYLVQVSNNLEQRTQRVIIY